MQCPSCGFENIPGRDRCAVCSTAFGIRQDGQSVFPPRARDRPWWERANWRLATSPALARTADRIHALFNAIPQIPIWLGPREVGFVLISAVPGLGLIASRREVSRGVLMLAASAVSVVLAVVFYRTSLCDWLVYGVVGLSMLSVWATIRAGRRASNVSSGPIRDLASALLVISAYMAMYVMLRLAVSPFAYVADVTNRTWGEFASVGDSLLVVRHARLQRGDIVTAWFREGLPWPAHTIGPVIGLPGDRVEIGDYIKVNGRRTRIYTRGLPGTELTSDVALPPIEVRLGRDQYWVLPTVETNGVPLVQALAQAGVVRSSDITGRATAVLGPPEHRRLLSAERLFGE